MVADGLQPPSNGGEVGDRRIFAQKLFGDARELERLGQLRDFRLDLLQGLTEIEAHYDERVPRGVPLHATPPGSSEPCGTGAPLQAQRSAQLINRAALCDRLSTQPYVVDFRR